MTEADLIQEYRFVDLSILQDGKERRSVTASPVIAFREFDILDMKRGEKDDSNNLPL